MEVLLYEGLTPAAHLLLRRYFEFIFLYQNGVVFQIDTKTLQCSKTALTEAWDPFDIPSNSTFEDQYFIGGPGDMMEVQEWSDRKPARKRKSATGRVTAVLTHLIIYLSVYLSG